jgi:hypothetical protein
MRNKPVGFIYFVIKGERNMKKGIAQKGIAQKVPVTKFV